MTIRARASAGLRRSGVLLAIVASLMAPPGAAAYERTFLPELATFRGDAEVGLFHEAYDNKTRGVEFNTTDDVALERVRLGTRGFIYDPRFITFDLDVAWGLRQERFENSATTIRSSRTTGEYNARAYVLPEHPYNLDLYASKTSPLFFGRLAPSGYLKSYENGAIARYRQKPFSLQAGISDNAVRGSHNADYDSETEHVTGTAYLGPTTTTLSYYEYSSDSASVSADRVRYSLSNDFKTPLLAVNTRMDVEEERQDEAQTGPTERDRLHWLELLRLPLPGRFLFEADYGIDRDLIRSVEINPDQDGQTFRRTKNSSFAISHMLYNSLRSHYRRQYLKVDSSTGKNRSEYQSISALYTKLIPGGVLALDGTLAGSDQKRDGAPSELREPHDAAVPGSFVLNSTLVDVSTITVRVREPSGSLLLLDSIHYSIQPVGERTEIFILTLPPPFAAGGQYHFEVDYQTIATRAEFRSWVTGYGIRFQLFGSSVSPYASHLESEQTLVSGTLPGGPDHSISNVVGVTLSPAPVIFGTEYQNYRSRLGPFEAWRASLDYTRQATPTLRVNGRAAYTRTSYEATVFGNIAYTDILTDASFLVRKDVPYKQMHVSVGASYRNRRSLSDTDSISQNAALGWKIGRLEVRANAITTYAITDFSSGKDRSSTQYYYLIVTRRFF